MLVAVYVAIPVSPFELTVLGFYLFLYVSDTVSDSHTTLSLHLIIFSLFPLFLILYVNLTPYTPFDLLEIDSRCPFCVFAMSAFFKKNLLKFPLCLLLILH